jgi:hypothetical protein
MQWTRADTVSALLWGLVLVAVLSLGAFVGEGATGTCMFVLMPFFAGLATVMPIARIRRFGAGVAAYLPWAVLGFVPLLVFDWMQSHALRGLWAVFAWTATGPLIGLCADAAWALSRRLHDRTRAALAGAAAQAATFGMMLVGLTLLYVDPTAADSHARLFDTTWYFTAPWMALNGAFGGFVAYALRREWNQPGGAVARPIGGNG